MNSFCQMLGHTIFLSYQKKLTIFCAAFFLTQSCLALGLNPNVGLRSVDSMLASGNCSGAMEILEKTSERGEPWAQLRLGWFSYTKQCSGVELSQGTEWLIHAACYESKTAWEKGSEWAVGPSGYFNARYSSKEAAFTLVQARIATRNLPLVHYWLTVGKNLYEVGDAEYVDFENRIVKLEPLMTPEQLNAAKMLDICEQIRARRTSGG